MITSDAEAWVDDDYVTPGANGFAVASFVLGLLWLLGVGSVLAIIFGHLGRVQIRREGGTAAGLGLAGLVLGYMGLGLMILFFTTGGDTTFHFQLSG